MNHALNITLAETGCKPSRGIRTPRWCVFGKMFMIGIIHPMLEGSLHPAALPPELLAAQCDMQFVRRSGPGGQHRNKVATAVVLLHRPTGIKAEANERRSQAENRTAAMFRLRVNLALEVRGVCKGNGVPSALWRSRCRGGRIEVSPTHDDFPALLAEALDVFASGGLEPTTAAKTLGCSPSQLVKLLKKEPRALAWANTERSRRALHPLR